MSTPEPHHHLRSVPEGLGSRRREIDELVADAYEAAAEPSRWTHWFDRLAVRVGHRASNVVIHGFGPTRYVSLDPPASGLETINSASVFARKALSKTAFAIAYAAGELFEDWSRLRARSGSGVQVFADASRTLAAGDLALLRAVLPHLHRALVLHFRLEAASAGRDALGSCLDEFATGTAILDRSATLLHANRAAREFFDGRSRLVEDDGRLRAVDRDSQVALDKNLARTTSARDRTLCGQRLEGGAVLWFRGLGNGRAIVYIATGGNERSVAPELLSDAFGLTRAEARVGSLLALGTSLDDIANELGISVHTARVHLKKIQKKVGTHRQAALVRRILDTVPRVNP